MTNNPDKNTLSRSQFLAIIGGATLTVALAKFSSIKDTLITASTNVDTKNQSRAVPTYGNSSYGGKHA